MPVATGQVKEEDWQTPDFVYEYYWEYSFPMTPTTFSIRRDNLKYIQYHGVWDIEELYDLSADPEERNNLIRHPDYADKLLPLRKALYQSLYPADNDKPAVPFNARLSEGLNLRKKGGLKAAPFPDWWKVEPNRPDKFNGLFPDTPLKIKKVKNGEAYFPFMEKSDKKQ